MSVQIKNLITVCQLSLNENVQVEQKQAGQTEKPQVNCKKGSAKHGGI